MAWKIIKWCFAIWMLIYVCVIIVKLGVVFMYRCDFL